MIDNKEARREQTCSGSSRARPGAIQTLLTRRPAFFDVTMEKDYKHEDLVLKCSGQFFPLAVESFGFWTPACLQTLRTIAAKTTMALVYSRRSPTSYSQGAYAFGQAVVPYVRGIEKRLSLWSYGTDHQDDI